MAKNTVLVVKVGKTTFIPLTDKESDIEQVMRRMKIPEIKSENVKEFNIREGKLTELEWFKLDLTGDDLNIVLPYIDAACAKIDPERISDLDLSQVRGIAVVETTGLPRESKIIASCIGSNLRFDRKVLAGFGVNGVDVEERTRGIEIPEAVHIMYENGKLFFKGFNYFSSLFGGVDKFFREVTDDDVNTFCNSPMFLFGEEFDPNLIGKRQRKQITLALPILPDFTDDSIRKQFASYAKDYLSEEEGDRIVKDDRFAINSHIDLAYVFHLIYADYFTNQITGEKMIAKRSEKLRF